MSNSRIIIKSGVLRTQVESMNIKSISEMSFTQKPDLSGTITLDKGAQPICLEWIDDVKSVYEKITELQRERAKEVEARDGLR